MSLYSAERLTEPTDEELVRWGSFPYFNPPDQLEPIVEGVHAFDKAHVLVLAEQKMIPAGAAVVLLKTLLEMEKGSVAEARAATGEGIHSGEAYLVAKLGKETAGYIHLGRSTPDLKGVSVRLSMRERLVSVLDQVLELRSLLSNLASRHQDTVMPSYDRVFQRGEATSLAQELLDTLSSLEREQQRLTQLYARINTCPPYYIASLDLPVDLDRLAHLLGLQGKTTASLNWDDVVEFLSVLAILNRILSSLAAKLGHWHSPEVRMVDFADRYCVTSSIRPQKRNPAGVEFVVGTEAIVIGCLTSVMALLRGVGAEQFQMGVLQLWRALDQTQSALRVTNGMLSTLRLDKDRMKGLALEHWAQAPYLAALIVKKESLPWRAAHQIVAAAVRDVETRGLRPELLDSDLIDKIAQSQIGRKLTLNNEEILGALAYSRNLAQQRSLETNLEEARVAIRRGREQLDAWKAEHEASRQRLEQAIESFIRELKGPDYAQ